MLSSNRNLYISVLRTVIKEELSDGETEIMNYGFNHEKKDYIAVYYGTPNNCELIWKKGDLLPTAPKDRLPNLLPNRPVVCSIGYRSICWNTQIPFGHIENHNTLVHLCILHFQIRVVIPSFGFAFDVRNGVFKECH